MQILVNLLSNAIKYTKKGAILVLVDWVQIGTFKGKPQGVIKFTVSDSGCGIPRKRRKDLFKFLDFSQFKDSISETNEIKTDSTKLAGTGLGISQKIAKELNSKIEFTSIVNTGSKFYLKLETSTVRESPIFAPFFASPRRGKYKYSFLAKEELSKTISQQKELVIDVKSSKLKKRSLSLDEGNGNYEKIGMINEGLTHFKRKSGTVSLHSF